MGIMHIIMDDSRITTIKEVREIIKTQGLISCIAKDKEETYTWIAGVLTKLRYHAQGTKKKDRRDILTYLVMKTGYHRDHVKKLAKRKGKLGKLVLVKGARNRFAVVYTPDDVALLLEIDNAHERLSGPATKHLFVRAYMKFDDIRYERLRHISVSHIYNLRGRKQYTSQALTCTKTNPTKIPIGIRKKPAHGGKPGYLRVDSVHGGDQRNEKGVYYVNIVDEVTQWEIIGCAEKISEQYLLPLLEELLARFPFAILNFHSDNGSEYINYQVAAMLTKLMVEQTKSRARHSGDNGLAEGKNGAVIRKHMGYAYIPHAHAPKINAFLRINMDDYLNYHRPCAFATDYTDIRGKVKKKYETYCTPYERFHALPNAEAYLKPEVTFVQLEVIAKRETDLESAQKMQKTKEKLFAAIRKC